MKVAECREWPECVSLAQVVKDAKRGAVFRSAKMLLLMTQ